jgi:hypothetical protein
MTTAKARIERALLRLRQCRCHVEALMACVLEDPAVDVVIEQEFDDLAQSIRDFGRYRFGIGAPRTPRGGCAR